MRGSAVTSPFCTLHSAFYIRVGRRATLTLPGNGAADRSSTCIVPFRRRMPHVFDHGSILSLKLRIVSAEFGDEERKSQSTYKAIRTRNYSILRKSAERRNLQDSSPPITKIRCRLEL